MQEPALESAIKSIRVRFGSQALTRAAEMPPPQPWRTGTPVDQLTGIDGMPRGRISLFTGSGTCGKLTFALALLARATNEFAHSVVVDGGGFDPWTLLPFFPELGALTVVGAPAPEILGEAAATLARAGAGFLLLLGEVPEHWLGPLESAANRSGTVVVGVVDSPSRALAHASSFSLGFTRTEWIYERDLLVGLRLSARCLKNRVAAPVGETELEVRYALGSRPLADFTPGVTTYVPLDVMEVETFASAVV